MMKIGFDAKRAYNNSSGLGNYSRFLIQALHTSFPENEFEHYTPKINSKYAQFYADSIQEPYGIHQYWRSFWRSYFIKSQLQKEKVDVYHGLSNELPFGIEKATFKKVVTIHDLIFLRYPNFYKKVDRMIYEKKFLHAAKTADEVIAVSNQTKTDLVSMMDIPEQKIEVIGQDCDEQFHRTVSSSEVSRVKEKYHLPSNYILSVGTIEERKNQLKVVQAFCKIKSDYQLILVGRKTAYQNIIEQYLKEKRFEHKVKILNNASFKDFPAMYTGATIAVYCSLFEGFGIPILEAFNIGTPVITSTGGCFEEVAGDAAMKVNATKIEEIQEAMSDLLENEAERAKLELLGKEQALKFRGDKIAKKVMEVYKR